MTDKTIDAIMRQAERFRLAELIPGGEYRAAHGALQSAITAALAQAREDALDAAIEAVRGESNRWRSEGCDVQDFRLSIAAIRALKGAA